MGTGWKTYLGVAIIVLSIAAKIAGVQIPDVTNAPDVGSLVGLAISLFGIRDKLNKLS